MAQDPYSVADGRPEGPCGRCGGTWMDLSNNVWRCAACGFDPERPAGRPAMAELDDAPPVPPAPTPRCNVCGPTVWLPRPDESTQCHQCGAVRG